LPEGYFLSAVMLSVDHQNCYSCAGCIAVCPEKALTHDLYALRVDHDLCTLCALCVKFCPVEALSLLGHKRTAGETA
jgi:ferredoxin